MHIGFKKSKLHLSWVYIIYLSLGLFISFISWAFYLFGDSEDMKEKDVFHKGTFT